MDTLPIELIRDIASVDIYTYHALITAYPRFARDVPPIPRIGKKDRFDFMIDFGFDVHVHRYVIYHTLIAWERNGQVHMNGLPALIFEDGSKRWCQHDKVHRDGDLPAIIHPSGSMAWHQHGKCHRDGDKPAIIYANGDREWWQHGQLHRDGAPAIIRADGTTECWQHDVRQG